MSRAVPPAVRERARSRSCPDCQARPDEKCAPDRAGRSQIHTGRIRDAQRSLEALPLRRILPPGTARHYMELDPTDPDTLVVSLHQDVPRELTGYQYEMTALLLLALNQDPRAQTCNVTICNVGLQLFLFPLNFLADHEVAEAVERLTARGFVASVGDRIVDPVAILLIHRRDLRPDFRMRWNAEKAQFPAPTPFGEAEPDV
ncbi:zinc finger domain-containing protein [Streptomyces alboflavus]|uniref:zinc finger domain-containing protein n=1 Tax=Streptomyces alboflavus TaxID=67267 RepID=UPI0036C29704